MEALERPTFRADLLNSLRIPEERKAYLWAAIEDGDKRVIVQAIRDIKEAMHMTRK
jgi:DNA-binding phage protein